MHGMLLGQGSPRGSHPWGKTMLGPEVPATALPQSLCRVLRLFGSGDSETGLMTVSPGRIPPDLVRTLGCDKC
jgi:hypothetical protein